MKNIIAAVLFAVVLIGCDKSNPVENGTTGDALYSEESMYKATIVTEDEIVPMEGNGPVYDSLRHGRMLGHLKVHVGLSDAQFDSVKVYAQTMFVALKDIRMQVHDSLITREQAHEKVFAVRAQFVASVTLILTQDQLAKFEEWVTMFWNKPPRGRGGRGHGGPGGPGGPGGHGPDRP